MRPSRISFGIIAFAAVWTGCQREEEGRLALFADVTFYTQKDLALPIAASDAQKRHDAEHVREWESILAHFGQLLDRMETAGKNCPARHGGELPSTPPGESLRAQVEAACDRISNDMARIDPAGVQSGLLPHARRFSRHLRTVLTSALDIACTQPEILRSRLDAARRELARMRDYLRLPDADAR